MNELFDVSVGSSLVTITYGGDGKFAFAQYRLSDIVQDGEKYDLRKGAVPLHKNVRQLLKRHHFPLPEFVLISDRLRDKLRQIAREDSPT